MEATVPVSCALCPRRCGANRHGTGGLCRGGPAARVARAAPHHWEEPCVSGTRGSGTVFFAGCGLGCAFCQNHAISKGGAGQVVDVPGLAALFLSLERQGVHNLNLVTATHYRPWVLAALAEARAAGLALPVVWNTGGYETLEAVAELAGAVNVWLFDLKFYAPALSAALTGAPDYFEAAFAALEAALRAAGPPRFGPDGLLQGGVVLRLLVLPGQRQDALNLLRAVRPLGPKRLLLSLMRQYTPPGDAARLAALPKALRRPLSSWEYRQVASEALALGFTEGYFQRRGSAGAAYVPPFGE